MSFNSKYTGTLVEELLGKIPTANNIWHSGNFNPSNYLPLSGGILSRNSGAPLIINVSDASDTGILFTISDTPKGWVGYDTTHGAYLYNNTSKAFLSIKDDGSIFYSKDTIWHSGNDGSGSGLDADLLDGKHAESFMNFTANTTYVDASMGNENLSKLASGDGYIEFWDGAGGWFNGKWGKLIAVSGFEGSLSGNASSATKLQTARTIWGQSFDGTGNVSGLISGVDGISFNSSNAINIDSNSNFVFKYTHLQDWSIQKQDTTKIFIVRNDGNVGIGTTSPAYKLDVSGVIQSTASKTNSLCFECDSSGNTSGKSGEINRYAGNLYIQYDTDKNVILCNGGGKVGIGTESPAYKLDVNGGIHASGSVTQNSDINLKNISKDVLISLDDISEAPLFEFTYKNDKNKRIHVGTSAQYWVEKNNWFCKKQDNGYYDMEIQNLALASAISIAKEFKKYKEETESTISSMKKEIEEFKQIILNMNK